MWRNALHIPIIELNFACEAMFIRMAVSLNFKNYAQLLSNENINNNNIKLYKEKTVWGNKI